MTTMAESFDGSVLLGFADDLTNDENAEVPLWCDRDLDDAPRAGTRPDDAVLIAFDISPEGCDSVTLTGYAVDDDLALTDSMVGVQVRIACRDRDRVRAIGSDIFALMHGRWSGMLGRVKLVNARRASGTNVGQDSEGRLVRTENYYLRCHRPSPNRT